MKYIITHPSKIDASAHFDDFLAISLLLDYGKQTQDEVVPVFRREPEAWELLDREIPVVDIGGQYNTFYWNFDHHQPDTNLPAAFVLVARHLGFENLCRDTYDWWDIKNNFDTMGPYKVAKDFGVSMDTFFKLYNSPIERFFISLTESDNIPIDTVVTQMMCSFGFWVVSGAKKFQDTLTLLRSKSKFVWTKGIRILYLMDDNISKYFGMARYRKEEPFNMTVTRDPRNGGTAIYRYEEIAEKVDFLQFRNHPKVEFVHNNNFLLVLKPECTINEMEGIIAQSII